MTSGDMKKRTPKEPKTYPRISIRIDPGLLTQVNDLKTKSGWSYGQIISRSLRKTLPILERHEAELKAA